MAMNGLDYTIVTIDVTNDVNENPAPVFDRGHQHHTIGSPKIPLPVSILAALLLQPPQIPTTP